MSNQIRLKRASGSDPGASDLVTGEIAVRTDNGKLFTKKDDGSVAEISGGGIDDGDKGDITVSNSGATFTIDNDAVTYAKIQNVSATNRILGRDSSGAGVIEEITPANLRTMLNVEDGATADQTKSDIDGLGVNAATVTVSDESSDTSCNVLFAPGASGDKAVKSGSNLTFNSSSGLLVATTFSGSGASLTSLNASNISSGTLNTARLPNTYTKATTVTFQATGSGSDVKIDAADHIILESGEEEDGNIYFRGNGGVDSYRFSKSGQTAIEGFLSFESLSADRTFTFPNTAGTLALTSSDITGNAATATTLATARTIAGVSFNGSANISLNNNAITNGAGYITSSNSAITNKLPLAGGTMTGELQINARLDVGNGSGNDHEIRIYKADNNVSDHLQFYNGTTRIGEIGCEDTTWLRINQETAKNIYTPRYIRADAGFFVDGTSKGINGSGNFIGGTIAGASDYSTLLRSNTADTASGDITFNGGAGAVTIAGNSDIRLTNGTWSGDITTPKIQAHNSTLYIVGGTSGIIFRENTANRWAIDGSGNFDPGADSTYDIGSNSLRVRNGYFDTLYGSGANITNVNATTLDSIDSGSFLRSDTADTMTGNLTMDGNVIVGSGHVFQTHNTGTRDKFRVWNSSTYAIGMDNGMSFGGLSDYAMTFQMSNTNARGFVFLDSSHSDAQGAMSVTTNGKMTVAHSLRLGYGESDTTTPGATYRLDVSGDVQTDMVSITNGILEVKDTIASSHTLTSGYNAMAVSPTVNNGVTVTVPSGAVWAIV